MKLHPLLACSLLLPTLGSLAPLALADDFTVEEKPFKIQTELKAVFLPTESQAIRIKPQIWTDFTITSLVTQGAAVKKGDVLIGIDTEKVDKYITKAEKARESAILKLAQSKNDLAQLEISTPRSLEDTARAEKETAENLTWFMEIGQPKSIETSKFAVKKAEQSLAYIEEELKQLEKMYNEDDLIEETEEIILLRTRNAVEATKFSVKSARINANKSLKTSIPRMLLSHQLSAKNAQIANAEAKENLPRALELKRLEVAKAILDDEKAIENLAKSKADRTMMAITAPADGIVYYGSIQDGRWSPEAATKALKIGGKLPAKTTVMTFIPANSPLTLSAFTEAANLPALNTAKTSKKATSYAITTLDRYHSFNVQLTDLATHPGTNGSFHVSLKPTIPKGLAVVPGMKATATITSLSLDNALKVPSDYLTRADDGGYTVKVKLADGKTSERKVTVGPASKDWAVITEGLEKGQVIVK